MKQTIARGRGHPNCTRIAHQTPSSTLVGDGGQPELSQSQLLALASLGCGSTSVRLIRRTAWICCPWSITRCNYSSSTHHTSKTLFPGSSISAACLELCRCSLLSVRDSREPDAGPCGPRFSWSVAERLLGLGLRAVGLSSMRTAVGSRD